MGILSFIKNIFSKKSTKELPITIADEFIGRLDIEDSPEMAVESPKMNIKKKVAPVTKEKQIEKPKATKKSTPKKDI